MEYSYQLTPQELLFLAKKLNKKSVFGIPAGSETQEQSSGVDSLLKKGYLELDFSGEMELRPGLEALIDACASCSRYLTLSSRSGHGTQNKTIWKNGTEYWCADRDQQTLFFREVKPEELHDQLLIDAIQLPETAGEAQVAVPQMLLSRQNAFRQRQTRREPHSYS